MSCFSDEVKKVFRDRKKDDLCTKLEQHHQQLVDRRVGEIQYGDPDKLTPKRRAILNSQALRQMLLHRADCLLVGAGPMLLARNVYGLALLARGHVEATAVLGFFCDRIDTLTKG